MQIIGITLVVSFVLNFLWENAHARLYIHPSGEVMTQAMLTIATLGDVLILSIFTALWWYVPLLKRHYTFVIPLGLITAFVIEKYALEVGRWAYAPAMPIVPFLNVGLSPMVQLATTGFILILVLRMLNTAKKVTYYTS
ncbi:MAG: hypothetical protein NUW00_02305 [Candidatus Kaiserbacteria bacterium]|nr:hypothetical protein [Candidatus Kaiserbacteria bacterium]